MIKVTGVLDDSIGEAIGLVSGTELISVDGRELEDFLDWEFLTADEEFTLVFKQPDDPAEYEVDVERPIEEPLGVAVEPPRIKRCANRCDFCFVEGNPDGLRDVLSIRDDDYRLSFRYGNFATLTNLKPWDTERIIAYRLSPLYVSVHATDPVVRRWVLRNPQAAEIIPQLRHFADHGIQFHTQIVMSPGVNDGPVLEQSLNDLYAFGDSVLSVSVVPVGLTEFSKHHLVREATEAECAAAVRLVERHAAVSRAERGIAWCLGADELYLRAGLPLPGPDAYDDFDQVENGVGSVRYLQMRIQEGVGALGHLAGKRIGVLTGTSMGALMPQVLAPLAEATGATFELMVLGNTLFGPSVTTAGLLPGAAFLAALRDRGDLDLALLPAEAINDDLLFMDDVEAHALQAQLPVTIRFSHHFTDALAAPVPA